MGGEAKAVERTAGGRDLRDLDGIEGPLIYFEDVPVYGSVPGIVRVELTANVLTDMGKGVISANARTVARLRCNVIAAKALLHALAAAIEMAENPPPQPQGGAQ